MTQAITISSGSPVPFSASAGAGTPWLTVTGGGTTPASVSVSVNPTGLSPGTYSGTLVLTGDQAANSPVLIPVQFTISAGITLAGQPSSLSFTYTQQGAVPLSQPLTISSSQPLNVDLAISPAESWLIVQGGGSTPAGLQISVNPDGLTPGTYSASILASSPNAVNSPLVVPVSLVVQSAPAITPSQGQYTFSYQVGGMGPANQTLTVSSTRIHARRSRGRLDHFRWKLADNYGRRQHSGSVLDRRESGWAFARDVSGVDRPELRRERGIVRPRFRSRLWLRPRR